MNRERFARLREILARATELPTGERAAYLNEACGDETELRQEAEAILAREGDGPSFLGTGGTDATVEDRSHPSESVDNRILQGPKQIGPYRVLEKLGEGGFGEVFAAEQSEPVKRRVALKVLKAGMDTREVLARFEAERQALAMMDHPNVCRVLDAGETPHGRPYFVMELIHGEPITEYCDHHRLTMEERLDLFLAVCRAIQHAHQKGVIHRDVKPSNVLVMRVDGKPVPKVIDFGIAKATAAHPLTEKTFYTSRGQVIGTPAYMSPEQAEMGGLDVDTRTDVYSLGVLLYELLTSRLPFESETLKEADLDEMRRIIREEEPPKPSTRVSTLGEEAKEAAAKRRTDPAHWRKALRRELDWIVMKSLEKDRNRRYETAGELAMDVGRYLADEPVLAGPPSTVYRLRKYVKRHRVAVGFAGMVAVGIVLAFVLVTLQNARIAAARDEAEVVTTTLEEMLASVDPTKSGRDVTVKEMLDQTAKTLVNKLKGQPLIEARLRFTIGRTYRVLGEWRVAEQHLRRALEIRRERLGEDDLDTFQAINDLAWVHFHQHHDTEAEALARRGLEITRRLFGEEHLQTLRAMHTLASMRPRPGREEEILAQLRETMELSRRLLGEEHRQTVSTMSNLGFECSNSGRLDEAEAVLLEALEIARRTLGDEEPTTLFVISNLGLNYWRQGRHDEAEVLQRECVETRSRVLGEEHPMTGAARRRLALAYRGQGRHVEAEVLHRMALEVQRQVKGDGHHETNRARYALAGDLALQGRSTEALSILRDALDRDFRGVGYGLHPLGADGISIRDDPDLASLHGDPEFEAIAEELRRRNEEGVTAKPDEPIVGEGAE